MSATGTAEKRCCRGRAATKFCKRVCLPRPHRLSKGFGVDATGSAVTAVAIVLGSSLRASTTEPDESRCSRGRTTTKFCVRVCLPRPHRLSKGFGVDATGSAVTAVAIVLGLSPRASTAETGENHCSRGRTATKFCMRVCLPRPHRQPKGFGVDATGSAAATVDSPVYAVFGRRRAIPDVDASASVRARGDVHW